MSQIPNSNVTTEGIKVIAESTYMPERSDPVGGKYLFTYHITLVNKGETPAKLLSRHWIIIDAEGEREEVKGPGVVGETPLLRPGESFEYDSFCPLNSFWGTMEGAYQMERIDGRTFDAQIGRFFLVAHEAGQGQLQKMENR